MLGNISCIKGFKTELVLDSAESTKIANILASLQKFAKSFWLEIRDVLTKLYQKLKHNNLKTLYIEV